MKTLLLFLISTLSFVIYLAISFVKAPVTAVEKSNVFMTKFKNKI